MLVTLYSWLVYLFQLSYQQLCVALFFYQFLRVQKF
jgi:hypothetical protein